MISKDCFDRISNKNDENGRKVSADSLEGFFVFSEGQFLYINLKCKELFGLEASPQEQDKLTAEPFDVPTPYRTILEDVKRVADGKPLRFQEYKDRRGNQEYCLEVYYETGTYLEKSLVIGVVRDVTEIKQRQLQLLQATKAAMDDEIIASFVHEINNPLYAIQLAVSHVLTTAESEKGFQLLQGVLKQVEYVADLMKKLRSFYRSSHEILKSLEIRSFFRELISFLEPYLKRKQVKVSMEIDGTPIFVKVDPHQLKQVFLCLIKNAVEAGETTEWKELKVKVVEGENTVMIEVIDSSYGTSQEAKEVMELGPELSACYRLIKSFGGKINVQGFPRAGIIYQVYLPRQGVS